MFLASIIFSPLSHILLFPLWSLIACMFQFRNFDMDQAGMKKQLSQLHTLLAAIEPELSVYLDQHDSGNMFFCFRWLLVLFKREFSHDDILPLWEVSCALCQIGATCKFKFYTIRDLWKLHNMYLSLNLIVIMLLIKFKCYIKIKQWHISQAKYRSTLGHFHCHIRVHLPIATDINKEYIIKQTTKRSIIII